MVLDILSKIKHILKHLFHLGLFFYLFLNVATRTVKITYMACIIVPIDSDALTLSPSSAFTRKVAKINTHFLFSLSAREILAKWKAAGVRMRMGF